MAVIENVSTEAGDVLLIKPETPIVGLISLYQFVDTTSNESITDYFEKQFRYSIDGGLTFGSWMDLSLINISNVDVTQYDQFVIEYQYTRVGTTPAVDLSFEDILVSGTIGALPYPIFKDTVFHKFFEINDINVYGWALNVLEKLYRNGLILPDYMKRGENNSNLEDEDFIVFWNSITHYFAVIVYFARQFEHIESTELMLIEFIKNKDLAFTEGNDLEDLLYLYHNYVDEYRKRGTAKILEKKTDNGTIDGELVRLINYKRGDELFFCELRNTDTGWCIGKSSPMWYGTENVGNMIKFVDANGKYSISSEEDYEVSFRITPSSTSASISLDILGYSVDDVNLYPMDTVTNAASNMFCYGLTFPVAGIEYLVKGVFWNAGKIFNPGEQSKTNIGDFNCLRSSPVMTAIKLDFAPGGETIYNVIFRPLKLNFSRGQLGIHNIIYLEYVNNNGSLNDQKIKEKVSNELVPYNTYVKTKQV